MSTHPDMPPSSASKKATPRRPLSDEDINLTGLAQAGVEFCGSNKLVRQQGEQKDAL